MMDLFRKGFYLGLGTGVALKETVGGVAEDLLKKGQVTVEDSRQFTKDVMEQIKAELSELSGKGEEEVERLLSESGVATKADFERMEKRLDNLEKKLKKA